MEIVRSHRHPNSNISTTIEPINAFPYTIHNSSDNVCSLNDQIFLLFLIKSAPDNVEQRQTIRYTWTNNIYFKNKNATVCHAFLLAMSRNTTTNIAIDLEMQTYKDIVQMSFLDNYYTNTHKTSGGIHWCVRSCRNVQFVVLVDDDFYVATDTLIPYLQSIPKETLPTLYMGKVCDNCRPQRYPRATWYITTMDYPYDSYPKFVHAGFIIMSMEFVRDLEIAIQFTKFFKFDDVFLSIVAHKLGVHAINNPQVYLYQYGHTKDGFDRVLASHFNGHTYDITLAWDQHVTKATANNTTEEVT